ncbi:hypothetical protein IEO21_02950 [Rhodonia placenta]|uniref:Vacuolar sorting protein Vps3844 C-terminal domain-containing protein n=1 Tax=Rhodonia placenta TaxID=104341 RepID=A0A8H7U4M4_9APHY|nr:hypothetical protein IEO21_02950 [Postia placenta]
MRGLVCLLLTGLSQAVRVYLTPNPSVPAELSASQAGAVLARHLGLDYYEPLEDAESYAAVAQQEAFVGRGSGSALLLSIPEEVAEDAVPSYFKESFVLSSSSSLSSLSSLVPTYLDRARHAYTHVFAQPSLPEDVPRIIDIFSVPSSASQTFLSEMTAIVDFLESNDIPSDKFAALELRGLSAIAAEHGRDSEQYRLASETIQSTLEGILQSRGLKFALVTAPTSVLDMKRQVTSVAQQPPQSPLPPPIVHPAEPIDAVTTCYTTADACGNSTNACSGHGQCVQASKGSRTCFVCSCASTKDAKGRTEYWAGSACEREDVSGPFVLVVGTVVALIVLVGGSIALLSSIGEQELPNTLTGGIVPTNKKD